MTLTINQKEEIIYRLMSEYQYYNIRTSGKWDKSLYHISKLTGIKKPSLFEFYIKSPSADILQNAHKIYNNTIKRFSWTDFYTSETILDFMRKHKVFCNETLLAEEDDDLDPVYYWTEEHDKRLEVYSESIDNIKIKLYRNKDAIKKQIEDIRADLKKSQKIYNELYIRKQSFDKWTIEAIASHLYTRYLYSNTFYDINKKQVKGLPPFLLDSIAGIVADNRIHSTHIREISHTSPWLSYYHTAKPNPFGNCMLSSDILSLMQLSRWYENIQHYEDYPEDIVNDDDMLDGWWILKERERPKKHDRMVESSPFNVETFIMAKSKEEADDIYSRNNKVARSIISNRFKQIADNKLGVKNQDLGDVKFDIHIQNNQRAVQFQQAKAQGIKTTTGRR